MVRFARKQKLAVVHHFLSPPNSWRGWQRPSVWAMHQLTFFNNPQVWFWIVFESRTSLFYPDIADRTVSCSACISHLELVFCELGIFPLHISQGLPHPQLAASHDHQYVLYVPVMEYVTDGGCGSGDQFWGDYVTNIIQYMYIKTTKTHQYHTLLKLVRSKVPFSYQTI